MIRFLSILLILVSCSEIKVDYNLLAKEKGDDLINSFQNYLLYYYSGDITVEYYCDRKLIDMNDLERRCKDFLTIKEDVAMVFVDFKTEGDSLIIKSINDHSFIDYKNQFLENPFLENFSPDSLSVLLNKFYKYNFIRVEGENYRSEEYISFKFESANKYYNTLMYVMDKQKVKPNKVWFKFLSSDKVKNITDNWYYFNFKDLEDFDYH
ncbi:MAG: hypothetical protein K9H62_13950 [Bacteroidales bacterium]|nr:hypothetical protein [Bacteroidales bacterium]